MGLVKHASILTWKNCKVILRSKLAFCCELIFPVIILVLIAIVVYVIPSAQRNETYSFEPIPIHGNATDLSTTVPNLGGIKSFCPEQVKLLYATSNKSYDSTAKSMMHELELRYANKIIVNHLPFDVMMDTLRRADHERRCNEYLGGIYFTDVRLQSKDPVLKYRILMSATGQTGEYDDWELEEFWPKDGPYSSSADLNAIPKNPDYWQSGFLSIQWAIGQIAINQSGKNDGNFSLYLHRMPTPFTTHNGVISFLKTIDVIWSLTIIAPVLYTARNIVLEKEAGIKSYLLVMGLQPLAFYLSHFIIGFLKSCFIVGALSGIISTGFDYVSASLFIVSSLQFVACALSFGILITTFVKRTGLVQFSFMFGWFGLTVVSSKFSPPISRVGLCILFSLNPVAAFNYIINQASNFETRMKVLNWFNLFSESTHSFTVGLGMLMLAFDFAWMVLLSYYLDCVFPTDDSPPENPLFFLHCLGIRTGNNQIYDETDHDANANAKKNENIEEGNEQPDHAGIQVIHVSKRWESTHTLAVDDLSFNAFPGQVTVLLGHNGAGKSTTFNIISGSISASSGHVKILGTDLHSNLSICRRRIGYCPQFNPLFDKLSVSEHLWLYAHLKNNSDRLRYLAQDILTLIADVGLQGQSHILAMNLSGGQKRKLCVGMALIGGSEVLLLDEPTAGMDPSARDDFGRLLRTVKSNRTILLTTHYMEEADSLGDQIGILVGGRMACKGTSEFLKKRFGTGYLLTIVLEHTSVGFNQPKINVYMELVELIYRTISKYSSKAKIETTQNLPEFSILLPAEDKRHFAALFKELEDRRIELHIKNFGLSFNTLEQVFLKVGDSVASEKDKDAGQTAHDEIDSSASDRNISNIAKHLFMRQALYTYGLTSKLIIFQRQLMAMIYRHFLNLWRNKLRTLFPILLSFFLLVSAGVASRIDFRSMHLARPMSLNNMEKMNVPLQNTTESNFFQNVSTIIGKIPNAYKLILNNSVTDLQTALLNYSNDAPPLGIGISVYSNKSSGNVDIYALFSGNAYHSPPLVIALVSNAFLGDKPDSIELEFELYRPLLNETSEENIFMKSATDLVISFLIITSFSTFTATFAMGLVEERSTKFKYQLLLTRLHVFTYWLSVFIWNFMIYVAFLLIPAVIFWMFDWMKGCETECFRLWMLYFWAYVPLIGVSTFIFNDPQTALSYLLSWSILPAVFFILIGFALSTVLGAYTLMKLGYSLALVFIPSFALAVGMGKITLTCNIVNKLEQSGILPKGNLTESMATRNLLGTEYELGMLISGIVFWTLLTILQSKKISRAYHELTCRVFQRRTYQKIVSVDEGTNDAEKEDIREEREKVMQANDIEMAVVVRDLYKFYGNFAAVKNVSFGVGRKECFGLLGVNGAGKTTTFDIITGVSYPSHGTATICGVNVTKSPPIGFCPQFDALPLEMTGREVLNLIATLNGFSDVKRRVGMILNVIGMENQSDKLLRNCSGGQRRRISVGLTLLTSSKLIMLDEPTSGIDPKTRRQIWNLLLAIRDHQIALLLTSHSMEECEALCSRIGFLNKGCLVGIGSNQELKSRFGTNFVLTLTVANPSEEVHHFLDEKIRTLFEAPQTDNVYTSSTYLWRIPRVGRHTEWSYMFRRVIDFCDRYPANADPNIPPHSNQPLIKDFSLTQDSLQQVFLALMQSADDGN